MCYCTAIPICLLTSTPIYLTNKYIQRCKAKKMQLQVYSPRKAWNDNIVNSVFSRYKSFCRIILWWQIWQEPTNIQLQSNRYDSKGKKTSNSRSNKSQTWYIGKTSQQSSCSLIGISLQHPTVNHRPLNPPRSSSIRDQFEWREWMTRCKIWETDNSAGQEEE